MTRLFAWIFKNKKLLIQAALLIYEYAPKLYGWAKEKIKKKDNGKIRN